MAAVQNPSVVGAVRDGQALSSNIGYRNSKCDSFLADRDAISSCDFLKSVMSPPSACKWEELPWLKAKGYYSLAAFVANKLELSLRLSWLHSHGKKRSSRMNSMANSHEVHKNGRDLAGIASNVFWRKKACVDWWSKVNETTRAEAFKLAVAKVAKFEEDAGHMFDKTPIRDFIPNRGLFSVSAQNSGSRDTIHLQQVNFQIQIILLTGRTLLLEVQPSFTVRHLLKILEQRLGIPFSLLRLLFAGKQLDNNLPLSFYNIERNATVILSLRLRGGAAGQSSASKGFSYKDAVHAQPAKKSTQSAEAPKPFLVDKMEETPAIEISHPSLDDNYQTFAETALICRFNGLWPRTADLYQWIHSNWTNNCKVFLCSKGFFIVAFAFNEDYQKALTGGPWFWGSVGLFLSPWFPDFDPSTAIITKLPIWVRLPNLPAHLWHFAVFQGIGDTLGRFLATDTSRAEKGLYTFGRICAEIDISKGLPDQIILKVGDFHWTQTLDYENTAFRCRHCHQTGHLQNSCASFFDKKKNITRKSKSKSWKPCDIPPMDDIESSSSDEEDIEVEEENLEQPKDAPSARTEDHSVPLFSQKRSHVSSPSDSDKESPPLAQNNLQVVSVQPDPNGWVKVSKKKGKKCRLEDSAHAG